MEQTDKTSIAYCGNYRLVAIEKGIERKANGAIVHCVTICKVIALGRTETDFYACQDHCKAFQFYNKQIEKWIAVAVNSVGE